MEDNLKRIRAIADYQFGLGCGETLFPEGVTLGYSKNTGRIRHVFLGGILLASLRPKDGFFTLSIAGAERLVSNNGDLRFTVMVDDEVADFIAQGRSVFAKHVIDVGEDVRPGCEVVVLDSLRRVLAVGRATLNKEEMLIFRVGVAVKVRHGNLKQ
jgi:uncharacterized protein with predicted RNA binding PUA domain